MKKLVFSILSMGLALLFSGCATAQYKVTKYKENKVFQGTTLIADMSEGKKPRVAEMDFQGNVIWEYVPNSFGERKAILDATKLQNNNILITIRHSGIYEIDRQGKIVWSHKDPEASHDADRLENGNTLYNLGWQDKGEDVVKEVNPQGEIVWSWNGMEYFNTPEYADINYEGWMHVNSVSRLSNGNTLVSIRNFNAVVEVNKSGKVVRKWTFRGKEKRTGLKTRGKIKGVRNHEPEILENGNILLSLRKPFRYVEFNPDNEIIVWEWRKPKGVKLRTNRDSNRLPNGNTLCTSSERIMEITPDGEIVWEVKTRGTRAFHKVIRIGVDGTVYGG